jgi:biopolymer transport protein ExbD
VEEQPLTVDQLSDRLKRLLTDPESALNQVVIQAGSGLSYGALMHVVEICSRQKLASGAPLKRLSFVELPTGMGN